MKIKETEATQPHYIWIYAKEYFQKVRLAAFIPWHKGSREAVSLGPKVTYVDLCNLSNILYQSSD